MICGCDRPALLCEFTDWRQFDKVKRKKVHSIQKFSGCSELRRGSKWQDDRVCLSGLKASLFVCFLSSSTKSTFKAFVFGWKLLTSIRAHLQKKIDTFHLITMCLPAGLHESTDLCAESGLKSNVFFFSPLLHLQSLLEAIQTKDSNLLTIKLDCYAPGSPTVMWPEGESSWTSKADRQTHEHNLELHSCTCIQT